MPAGQQTDYGVNQESQLISFGIICIHFEYRDTFLRLQELGQIFCFHRLSIIKIFTSAKVSDNANFTLHKPLALSHAILARQYRFKVRGDFGLNVYNSAAADICRQFGFKSVLISPQTAIDAVKNMPKMLDAELMVYGRLRLMYTGGCLIKDNTGLCSCDSFEKIISETGENFHISSEFGCRNSVYSSKKLYIGDKEEDYGKCGLWAVRLCFTTEKQGECVKIMKKFKGIGNYEPTFYTRGAYYRSTAKKQK